MAPCEIAFKTEQVSSLEIQKAATEMFLRKSEELKHKISSEECLDRRLFLDLCVERLKN